VQASATEAPEESRRRVDSEGNEAFFNTLLDHARDLVPLAGDLAIQQLRDVPDHGFGVETYRGQGGRG